MLIAFASSNWNFIHPLESEFSKHHEIIGFYFNGPVIDSVAVARLQHLLMTADVVFFDFAQEPLLTAQRLFHKAKIVVRLHGIELFHQFTRVNWNKVDLLIVSPVQNKRIRDMVEMLPCKVLVKNIGTEPWLFNPDGHQHASLNLCMAGNVLPHKGIYPAVQALAPLLKTGQYKFTIHGQTSPGAWRDELKRETVFAIRELVDTLELQNYITWVEPQEVEEYASWLASQDIIISNSEFEGYHKVLFDAMACGVYPLVNCWYGAELLFDKRHIFYQLEELRQKVEWFAALPQEAIEALRVTMRNIVTSEHDSRKIAAEIREEIECLVK